jgi:hypothetical protein
VPLPNSLRHGAAGATLSKRRLAEADEVDALFWCNEWLFHAALLDSPPSLIVMWMRWGVL